MSQEMTEGSSPPESGAVEAGAAKAGAGSAGEPANAAAGGGRDWAGALSESQRALLETKGWKGPGAILDSYSHLERMIGRDKVAIPKEGDAEAWSALYDRLGRPEAAEDYEIAVPEGTPRDEAFEQTMRGLFHSAGLTRAQVNALAEGWHGYLSGESERAERSRVERAERDEEVLRADWGGNYDRNLEQARRAARRFGDAGIIDGLEETVGRAAVFRMFARIGAAMAEDDLEGAGLEDGESGGFDDPHSVRARIAALKADPAFREAWLEHSHPGHKQAVARMAALSEKLEVLS